MKTKIKKTYVCRQVDNWMFKTSIDPDYKPKAGDVGIFEVLYIGKHNNVQGDTKRIVTIIEGDHIMAAFGTRYATEQFEGYIPAHLNQELHILGAGGTIGVVESMHNKFKGAGPTKLRLVGMIADETGKQINTRELMKKDMVSFTGSAASAAKIILSVGSSMDSGKTTTAAYLVQGLKKAGMQVAYIKLTGTVYTKDADLALDLGADIVADFGDMGFPSTYLCSEEELLSLYETLLLKVLTVHPDYIIIEIADGLYQRETKMLMTSSKFINTTDIVIFSSGDSLSAINGVNILNTWGIHPLLLSGLFTTSPLLIKEVTENTHIPVFTINELAAGRKIIPLLFKSLSVAGNQ